VRRATGQQMNMAAELRWPRILFATLAGYVFASNLNWGIATFLLNPWATPLFDGFMRQGDGWGTGINILKMTAGFLPHPLFAVVLLIALPRPLRWGPRALLAR
jgi:hypothetical protein